MFRRAAQRSCLRTRSNEKILAPARESTRCRQPRATRRERGFTLIEVIVALAILSGAVAMAYRGLGQSWRAERAGSRAAEALRIAEMRLAGIGSQTPLAEGQVFSGEEAGVSWQVHVERRPSPGEADGSADAAALPPAYWLILDAEWTDATARQPQSLRLRTLKFGPPP